MKLKVKTLLLLISIWGCSNQIHAQTALDTLFHNSYKVFQNQRTSVGTYQARLVLANNNSQPASSVAVIGTGLVSLCIADAMGWEPNGMSLALTTLKSMNGSTPGFVPNRNPSGYFPHYIDKLTGARIDNSEYSTMDNAVLMCGAQFCKKYFQNSAISYEVDMLWNSIDWSQTIADPNHGELYLSIDDQGIGNGNKIKPYNEYMLVAWMAMNAEVNTSGPAHVLWNNYFLNTDNLTKTSYQGIDVLTAPNHNFQAEHTYQMPYFMCHYYTTSPQYLYYMNNGRMADTLWWHTIPSAQSYEWGISAGSGITNAYSVDAINDNVDAIVSPHTLAGYLPINPQGKNDLIALYNNNKGVYALPFDTNSKILWRYSVTQPNWQAPVLQCVDYATFLFGMASLPEYLGTNFFSTNNNFFDAVLATDMHHQEGKIKIYPNPVADYLTISGLDKNTLIQIYDIRGRILFSSQENKSIVNIQAENWEKGIYFIAVNNNENKGNLKFIKE